MSETSTLVCRINHYQTRKKNILFALECRFKKGKTEWKIKYRKFTHGLTLTFTNCAIFSQFPLLPAARFNWGKRSGNKQHFPYFCSRGIYRAFPTFVTGGSKKFFELLTQKNAILRLFNQFLYAISSHLPSRFLIFSLNLFNFFPSCFPEPPCFVIFAKNSAERLCFFKNYFWKKVTE